jgi:predicted nucleic acid-binding protein
VVDPDDDPIVATAVEGNAEVLCTRDKHLLGSAAVVAYCASHGVRVIDDVELIKLLRQP